VPEKRVKKIGKVYYPSAMLCKHFPSCGGCIAQDIPYELQLQAKQTVIESLYPSLKVSPIIPCKNPWHYRNKMEFSFSQNKAGDRFLGLILKKSRGKVFNLEECFIAPEGYAEILSRVRTWWEETPLRAFHFRSGEGTLRTFTLRQARRTGQKMALLTVSGNPQFALTQTQLNQFVQALGDPSMSIFLQIQQAIAGQPTQFFEMHLAGPAHIVEELSLNGRRFEFKISPTSFFQPNTEQAEVLYQTALNFPTLTPDSIVYDLYCGTATLGILCAPRVKQVIGIELNPHAIFDGKMNAEINNLSNIELYCGDVAKVLSEQTLPRPDLVILDPPRAGLDTAALEILRGLSPPQILYISCNPKTQAQNLLELPDYEKIHIQPIDQFPHTPHIENIVYLSKK
jgi:23S rRNA (uracil1939-C5)-methyltransferase